MMMKKNIRLFMLLMVLCLLFTGCHGRKEMAAFESPLQFDESRTYEITFWAKNDTNMTQMQIYKDAIAGFEQLYPNIKVKLVPYTDYGRIYQDVLTNIPTNTTPNVCITYPDHIATYMEGGNNTVVPLDTLMNDSKYGLGGTEVKYDAPAKDEIVPKFLSECQIGGVTYALPYMRSTEALYVNKTYVEKLGYTLPDVVTWDFIWEVSEAAMAKNADGTFKVNGQKVLIPFIYKSTDNMMIQYLKQSGIPYSGEDGEVLIFNDQVLPFLQTIAAYAKDGVFSTFSHSGYPSGFLNAGQCIFAVDSTAGATWMGTDAPNIDIAAENLVEFETVVLPIPQVDVNNPIMISQGPSMCIFNKADPQEVLASWLFMQYMLTNDVQIAYAQTEGYVPVTLKAQNSDVYQDYLGRRGEDNPLYYDIKLDASRLLIDNTENTFVTPVFNGSANLRNAAGQMIEEAAKAGRRKKAVDQAFADNLFTTMRSRYDLSDAPALPEETAQQATDENGLAADPFAVLMVQPEEKPLGPLPREARILLITLAAVWVLIGAYALYTALRKKRKQ